MTPFAEELTRLMGEEAMRALCAAWPGIPLTVPKHLSPDSAIPLQIGVKAALLLIGEYGGQQIVPPKLHKDSVLKWQEAARRDREEAKMSIAKLSLKYGRCARHMRKVLNRSA